MIQLHDLVLQSLTGFCSWKRTLRGVCLEMGCLEVVCSMNHETMVKHDMIPGRLHIYLRGARVFEMSCLDDVPMCFFLNLLFDCLTLMSLIGLI